MIAKILTILLFSVMVVLSAIIPDSRLPIGGWNPGIDGGIPTTGYTQWCNVKVSIPGSALVAVGNGSVDDAPAIQAALDLVPSGSLIYVPAGIYVLSNTLAYTTGNAYPNRSNIVIRGDGPTSTLLHSYAAEGNVFEILHGSGSGAGTIEHLTSTNGNYKGMSNIVVGTLHGMYGGNADYLTNLVGNWVFINIYQLGSHWGQWCNVIGYNLVTSNLNFWPPLWSQYPHADTNYPVSVSVSQNPAYRFGIEDLAIEQKISRTSHGFFFKGAIECWLKNVDSKNIYNWNVRFEYATKCNVRDSYFHDTTWPGSCGGNSGYGVGTRTTSSHILTENNIFKWLRHAMIAEGGSGNVWAYNYSTTTINEGQTGTDYVMADMDTHGLIASFNLFEGNIAQRLSFDNAEWWEGLGGICNTAFRNWAQRIPYLDVSPANTMSPMANQYQNYSNNIVGNILGNTGITFNAYFASQTNFLSGVFEKDWWKDSAQVPGVGDAEQWVIYTNVAAPSLSLLYHQNWDYWTGTNYVTEGVTGTLVNSYYLTEKPSWWGSGAWPPIGPDLSPMVSSIPAQVRFNGTGWQPPPPEIIWRKIKLKLKDN